MMQYLDFLGYSDAPREEDHIFDILARGAADTIEDCTKYYKPMPCCYDAMHVIMRPSIIDNITTLYPGRAYYRKLSAAIHKHVASAMHRAYCQGVSIPAEEFLRLQEEYNGWGVMKLHPDSMLYHSIRWIFPPAEHRMPRQHYLVLYRSHHLPHHLIIGWSLGGVIAKLAIIPLTTDTFTLAESSPVILQAVYSATSHTIRISRPSANVDRSLTLPTRIGDTGWPLALEVLCQVNTHIGSFEIGEDAETMRIHIDKHMRHMSRTVRSNFIELAFETIAVGQLLYGYCDKIRFIEGSYLWSLYTDDACNRIVGLSWAGQDLRLSAVASIRLPD